MSSSGCVCFPQAHQCSVSIPQSFLILPPPPPHKCTHTQYTYAPTHAHRDTQTPSTERHACAYRDPATVTLIHMHPCKHAHTHRYTQTHIDIHTCTHHIYVRTCSGPHRDTQSIHTGTNTHVCAFTCTYIHTHMQVHTCTHMLTHRDGGQEARKSSHLSSLSLPPAPANTCSAPGPGGIPSRRQASSSGQGPRHKHVGTEVRQAWPGMKSRDRASDKRHL